MRIAQASVGLVLCLVASSAPGQAQTPTPTPAAPPPASTQTPATAANVVGRVLSLEEAIGIALETQPLIQARLSDYLAAAHRVDQAFSPLLPQVSATWNAARTQSALSQERGARDPR